MQAPTSDITCVWAAEGLRYLAVVLDSIRAPWPGAWSMLLAGKRDCNDAGDL